jgi:hypothetical protein
MFWLRKVKMGGRETIAGENGSYDIRIDHVPCHLHLFIPLATSKLSEVNFNPVALQGVITLSVRSADNSDDSFNICPRHRIQP